MHTITLKVFSPLPPPKGPFLKIIYYNWGLIALRCCSGLCHAAAAAKSLQLCPTLCDPIDGSPPGSAIDGFSRFLPYIDMNQPRCRRSADPTRTPLSPGFSPLLASSSGLRQFSPGGGKVAWAAPASLPWVGPLLNI